MTDPAGAGPSRIRRTRHRVRRHAVVLGVLLGLAAAPVIGHTARDRPFDTRQGPAAAPASGPVADVAPAAATTSDQGTTDRPGEGSAESAGDDLPVFTHRSAEIEQVARHPIRLRMRSLGVDAPVQAFGRDGDGQLDVPRDAATVAWYRAGSIPGAAGSSVLAAHVDYNGSRGVFYDLSALRAGDTVYVDFDDGTTLTFDVFRRTRYDKQRLPIRRLFTRNGDAVLTLITCGGQFNATTRHYDSNTVVQAALRSS